MNDGDQAAILKFNGELGVSIVQPFIAIDHGVNSAALEAAVMEDYPGSGTTYLRCPRNLPLNILSTPPNPLPAGPKAIILVSDAAENSSVATELEVITHANDNSIPIFTIGVGSFNGPNRIERLTNLAELTGGVFLPAPNDAEIAEAYETISQLLNNEYLLTIASGITDCAEHTLEIAVVGQATPASATFTRRDCDVMPDPFSFTSQTGLNTDIQATSNTITITGIDIDVEIDAANGRYSVGCNGTFTSDPGTISNGQTVCVRHTTSTAFSATSVTTLTVGDASATFTTTTRSEPSSRRRRRRRRARLSCSSACCC